ncbi:MAG: tRNA (N6-isopentenyl adenosine(37)-C2)-methylthiotransferase MiaB [Ruminococcaceae bacterium]|nr:tRNA (N6-isopentenyl adenosine(37)-C2)-methylthiotransferase MiaB [Oscillospiraceae bacterium]
MRTAALNEKELKEQLVFMEKVKAFNGQNKKFIYIETFGCQQNEADSELIYGMAEDMLYEKTGSPEEADLIIVNTCAVREHAELKALSITGQFKHLKEKKASLLIGICGCMVSQEHRKDDIKHKYPYVDFLFGTFSLRKFPEVLYEALISKKRTFNLNDPEMADKQLITEGFRVKRESSFKAWVSIMYGCNNFCTYCVVPYVRGRERSRRKEDILSEINDLASRGYKEITLLGQNVNSYGRGLYENYGFKDLLEDICALEGDILIRFMTSHPKDVPLSLIDVMAEHPKLPGKIGIAKQFHLPIQCGNDRVLKAMNRNYTSESYLRVIDYMKEKIPGISITTDIIVGFPGETDEEFEDTLRILEKVEYDNIYSFIYSKRKNTPAADMKDQVSAAAKKSRMTRLLELQGKISKDKNKIYEDSVISVLVEGRSKTNSDKLTGRTEKNKLVHFEGDDSLIGSYCNVLVTHAETYALYGELADK